MAALMVLTRLKEQGVEEPGLLPSDAPHCRAMMGGRVEEGEYSTTPT